MTVELNYQNVGGTLFGAIAFGLTLLVVMKWQETTTFHGVIAKILSATGFFILVNMVVVFYAILFGYLEHMPGWSNGCLWWLPALMLVVGVLLQGIAAMFYECAYPPPKPATSGVEKEVQKQ